MKRLLPLILLVSAPAIAADVPLAGTKLSLSASAMVSRVPDVATVSAGVVTQAGSAGEAMRANAAKMSAVVAALHKAGLADRDLRTSAVTLAPQYRYAGNQPQVLTGYQATNRVSVRLHDLQRVGMVLDALVAAGANQIDGPDFAIDHPDAALDDAREAAVVKARVRAELYAKAAGLHVLRLVSLSEMDNAPPVIRPMAMMTMRKDASTPVEVGEQNLSVTVDAVFELN